MWSFQLKQCFRQYCGRISSLAIAISTLMITPPSATIAAEEINFRYGIASQSISIEELETFAKTGETSPALDFLLEFTGQNPEIIRLLLVQEIPMDAVTASTLLNSPLGEYVLDRASNIVNTGASEGNREALRGALIESTQSDRKISLIEVWRNYPTKEVDVDGQSWNHLTQGFSETLQQVGKTAQLSIALLQTFLNQQ
jgi:hypothetical protein